MAKVKVTREGWRCQRCQYEWVPRSMAKIPIVCPSCKTPYWNRPRKAVR